MAEPPILNRPALPDVGSYHDLRSLNRLRELGTKDEAAALRAAAKQFESVFLQELLKSMRAANDVFEDDDFFGGGGNSEFYEQMHDEQLALSLANQQSLGLAEVMVRQLSKQNNSAGPVSDSASLQAPARPLPNRPASFLISETSQVSETPPISVSTPAPTRPATPLEFVRSVLPHAETAANALGVDPALLVAQTVLETGWGKSLQTFAADRGQPLPNVERAQQYFGIKADGRWSGKTVTSQTLEYVEGVPQRQRASFRAYDSVAEAFSDYRQFLQDSPRYIDALANAADPEQFAHKLQAAGYATDPAYANKLLSLFRSDKLRELIAEARKLL